MDQNTFNAPCDRIVRATTVVIVVTILVKLFGFAEKVALAYFFGTGMEIDAYLIAVSVPLTAFIMTREIVEPAFLPTFTAVRRLQNENAAWRLLSLLLNSTAIILLLFVIIGLAAAQQLVSLFAPGFEGAQQQLTVKLTRYCMPAVLFLGLSAITYITLNAYKRFAVPACGDLFLKAVPLIALAVLYNTLGIVGLAIGVVFGALSRLLVHGAGLWRKWSMYGFVMDPRCPAARKMRQLAAPLILGILFSQLNSIVDNMFASTLQTGAVSALAYARKLADLPVLILPFSMGIVLFPFFSELSARHQGNELTSMFMHAAKIVAIVFVPLGLAFALMSDTIVSLAFERGAFDSRSHHMTSAALVCYSFGIFAFALEALLVQYYFSMSDTGTPVFAGIGCVLLNIMLAFGLIRIMGHSGIALALTISKTVKVFILFLALKRKLPGVRMAKPLRFLLKVGASSVPMGAVIFYMTRRLVPIADNSTPSLAAVFLLTVLSATVLYATALALTRDDEVRIYARYLRTIIPLLRGGRVND